jgi:acetyl-CoA carboxylase carboxyltransferase component
MVEDTVRVEQNEGQVVGPSLVAQAIVMKARQEQSDTTEGHTAVYNYLLTTQTVNPLYASKTKVNDTIEQSNTDRTNVNQLPKVSLRRKKSEMKSVKEGTTTSKKKQTTPSSEEDE